MINGPCTAAPTPIPEMQRTFERLYDVLRRMETTEKAWITMKDRLAPYSDAKQPCNTITARPEVSYDSQPVVMAFEKIATLLEIQQNDIETAIRQLNDANLF